VIFLLERGINIADLIRDLLRKGRAVTLFIKGNEEAKPCILFKSDKYYLSRIIYRNHFICWNNFINGQNIL
jgi:hypothetical protein